MKNFITENAYLLGSLACSLALRSMVSKRDVNGWKTQK